MNTQKEIINSREVVELTGFSMSWLRKAVKNNLISYYKPNARTTFFKRSDIEAYMLSNHYPAKSTMNAKESAKSYFHNGGRNA